MSVTYKKLTKRLERLGGHSSVKNSIEDTSENNHYSSLNKKRLAAFYIDLLTIFFIMSYIKLLLYNFATIAILPYMSNLSQAIFNNNINAFSAPLYILTVFSYYFLLTFITNGKTLGALICNLRLVNIRANHSTSTKISLNTAFIRACYYSSSILLAYIPFLFNLFKKENLGYGDILSQTKYSNEIVTFFHKRSKIVTRHK